jgi:hypothetical protein
MVWIWIFKLILKSSRFEKYSKSLFKFILVYSNSNLVLKYFESDDFWILNPDQNDKNIFLQPIYHFGPNLWSSPLHFFLFSLKQPKLPGRSALASPCGPEPFHPQPAACLYHFRLPPLPPRHVPSAVPLEPPCHLHIVSSPRRLPSLENRRAIAFHSPSNGQLSLKRTHHRPLCSAPSTTQ